MKIEEAKGRIVIGLWRMVGWRNRDKEKEEEK